MAGNNLISFLSACSCILFGLLQHSPLVAGVSIASVKEGSCIQPPVDSSFNLTWAVSSSEWFYPIWSKYEVYRWTTSVSGFDERVISPELIDSSCQILTLNPSTGARHIAFAGTRSVKFESVLVSPGVFDWVEIKSDGSKGGRGRSYVTLTDNNSFYVTVTCWAENIKSYVVQSTTKSLNEQTKKLIKEHLSILGFDVANKFYEMPYENCAGLPPQGPAIMAAPAPAPRPQDLRTAGSSSSSSILDRTDNGFQIFSPLRFIARLFGQKFEIIQRVFGTIFQILTTPIRLIMSLFGLGNRSASNTRVLG